MSQPVAADFTRFVYLEVMCAISPEMTSTHVPDVRQVVDGSPDRIVLVGNDITSLRICLRLYHDACKQAQQQQKLLFISFLLYYSFDYFIFILYRV